MAFDINKLTNREKNIVGVLILILSSLPFFYLTLPGWNKYIESGSKTEQNKRRLNALDLQIKRLEKFKQLNIDLSKKLEKQKLYLAKSYEIDFLVEDLKKLCDESSISLESFTPAGTEPINIVLEKQAEAETQGKTYDKAKLKQTLDKLKGQDLPVDLYKLPIEVRVTGDFTDILELFKKLEKYGRVISIDNISIGKIEAKETFGNRLTKSKPKKQSTVTGSLFGNFDLIAYSLPKEDETISATQLQKSLSGTNKSTFKFKRKRT